MIKIPKLKVTILLSVFFFVLSSISVFAVEIYFKTDSTAIMPGELLEVSFILDTEGEDINAVEGTVLFPSDVLKTESISEANSTLTFWVEKPKVYEEGKIRFAGVVPGGYQGKTGLLFSITFLAKKEGSGIIEIKDSRILLNDGQGTQTKLSIPGLQINVTSQAPPILPKPKIKDNDPPEIFTPEIASAPSIFEGKYFLVFLTQDKNSGIDHYEVCEGKKSCIIAESPYLLKNQDLDEEVIVKAIDRSGNERVAVVPPQKAKPWYQNYLYFAILIIGAFFATYIIWKFLWKKRRKRYF